jgi:hypothetical protein
MPLSTFVNQRPPKTLRGLSFLALTESGTVQTRTQSSDDAGDAILSWAPGTTVPCRLYPVTRRSRGREIGGAINERTTHYLVTPQGTVIGLSDRVVLLNRGTFEITMIMDHSDALLAEFEVFQVS